jgi:hypothetical protein
VRVARTKSQVPETQKRDRRSVSGAARLRPLQLGSGQAMPDIRGGCLHMSCARVYVPFPLDAKYFSSGVSGGSLGQVDLASGGGKPWWMWEFRVGQKFAGAWPAGCLSLRQPEARAVKHNQVFPGNGARSRDAGPITDGNKYRRAEENGHERENVRQFRAMIL